MPTYLDGWDETVPGGGSEKSLGDDAIRGFKRGIRQRLSTDHVFEQVESDPNVGYHKQVTLVEAASLPASAIGRMVFGAETHPTSGLPELAWKDENNNKGFLTSAGKLDVTQLGDLSNIPDTAGVIPEANLPTNLGIPSGGIILWSGLIANIPTGFFLCDGSNSTPDLRDRMIVGAKQDDAGTPKTNITGALTSSGGAATKTLATSEIPPHTHGCTMYNANGWASGSNWQASNPTNSAGTFQTNSAGGGASFSILNPYYSLAYIMKE